MKAMDQGEFLGCLDCGTTVAPAVDRLYAVGYQGVLCMHCSLARGGSYEERTDHWTVAPEVGDLLEPADRAGRTGP
jgi:hypothetical protein